MPVTFPVDSVKPASALPLSTSPLDAIQAISGVRPEAFGSESSTLINPIVQGVPGRSGEAKMNGFLKAIHEAYANHYPLSLSPDDVWLAIAQGFSYHVNANAEQLRKSFVKHEGKAVIKVRRDEFFKGSPTNNWVGCFSEFSQSISEHIGKDKRDLLVSDFSTSTSLHKAVSEVTMMNTLKAYFDYVVETRCGIPTITLTGTKGDWERIVWKVANLTPFQCSDWIRELLHVLNNFVIAFDGLADPTFWTNFYKIEGPKGSGGTTVSGWVNVFFPYLNNWRNPGEFNMPNPSAHVENSSRGVGPDQFPLGITSTPFIWLYCGTTIPMQFLAGFIGTTQDPTSKVVRPIQGWGIAES
jgi:hypothetical protein